MKNGLNDQRTIGEIFKKKMGAVNDACSAMDELAERLNLFLNRAKDIHNIKHQDVLFKKIIDYSIEMTGAESGSILLAEGENLKFKYFKGVSADKLMDLSIAKTQGIVGWVYGNGEILNIEDASKDKRFYPGIDNITGMKTHSVLCAPLRVDDMTVGVIELINKSKGVFGKEDEGFLDFFSDQAASAIMKTKMLEDQKNYEIHLTDILLDAMDNNITEKRGHSKRVAQYCLIMARAINMKEEDKAKLYKACLLHDIGFLKIKLHKVESKEEYRKHVSLAYEILKPINFYSDIAPLVLSHHERYDGSGYPSGLKGDQIPIASRMIAIAETFDAITSRTSYKYVGRVFDEDASAFSGYSTAITELRENAGTQFDPALVKIFLENISEGILEDEG